MAKTLQHRRDTTANLASVSGAIGEFFMDTTKNTLVVMDGSTNGGHPLQLELVSGTTIKTVNGTSLLGSGNITISGGSADFSAVAEDVLPSFDGVYDLGSSTKQWYDLFVSNSVTIDGGSLTGNATGLVTSTMLLGDLLVTTNTITPDASTALQYNGDQGVVDILGNLDVSAGDWMLAPTVETVSGTPPLTTGTEGAIRYNKDQGKLQVYTNSWDNIVPNYTILNQDVDALNWEPGKKYLSLVTNATTVNNWNVIGQNDGDTITIVLPEGSSNITLIPDPTVVGIARFISELSNPPITITLSSTGTGRIYELIWISNALCWLLIDYEAA